MVYLNTKPVILDKNIVKRIWYQSSDRVSNLNISYKIWSENTQSFYTSGVFIEMVDGIYTSTFQTPNNEDNLLLITNETNKKYVHFKIDETATDMIFAVAYQSQQNFNFKIRDTLLNLLHTISGTNVFDNVYKLNLNFLSSPDSYIIEFGNDTVRVELPFTKEQTITEATSGSIQIEPNRWQLVSIPVKYGYFDKNIGKIVNDGVTRAKIKEYVIDQVEYKYGPPEQFIEVCNAYIGDKNYFYSFVVGFTNPASEHNFPLIYLDYDSNDNITREEITGFWIKSISNQPIIIEWKS